MMNFKNERRLVLELGKRIPETEGYHYRVFSHYPNAVAPDIVKISFGAIGQRKTIYAMACADSLNYEISTDGSDMDLVRYLPVADYHEKLSWWLPKVALGNMAEWARKADAIAAEIFAQKFAENAFWYAIADKMKADRLKSQVRSVFGPRPHGIWMDAGDMTLPESFVRFMKAGIEKAANPAFKVVVSDEAIQAQQAKNFEQGIFPECVISRNVAKHGQWEKGAIAKSGAGNHYRVGRVNVDTRSGKEEVFLYFDGYAARFPSTDFEFVEIKPRVSVKPAAPVETAKPAWRVGSWARPYVAAHDENPRDNFVVSDVRETFMGRIELRCFGDGVKTLWCEADCFDNVTPALMEEA